MTAYAFAVKVRKVGPSVWRWDCPACRGWMRARSTSEALRRTYRWAVDHAATCPDLHWLNWSSACPSCKQYGQVAPACPVCLGRGWIAEREGLS